MPSMSCSGSATGTLPEPDGTKLLLVNFHASMTALSLSNFSHFVKQQFPHRADAVALADEVKETLRQQHQQQHGGPCPEEFIWDIYTNKIRLPSLPGPARTMERWADLPGLSQEFSSFHPFERGKEDQLDVSEGLISAKTAFLRRWLENRRSGS